MPEKAVIEIPDELSRVWQRGMGRRKLQELFNWSQREAEFWARVMSKSVQDVGMEESARMAHLESQVRVLTKSNKMLDRELGKALNLSDNLRDQIQALSPIKYSPTGLNKQDGKTLECGIFYADWHIGAYINPGEVGGINEYNFDIATQRVHRFSDMVIDRVVTARKSGQQVKILRVAVMGDLLSGDIHDELSKTNEFPLPRAIAKAAMLLADSLRMFTKEFEKIYVVAVAGNHSRLTKKPEAKRLMASSLDPLIVEISSMMLKDCPSIDFHIPEAPAVVIEWPGERILLFHGDGINSPLSIPVYGLRRRLYQELQNRFPVGGFNCAACGHFHTGTNIEDYLYMCPSLMGPDEYSVKKAMSNYPPSQAMAFLDEEYGLTGFQCLRVDGGRVERKKLLEKYGYTRLN